MFFLWLIVWMIFMAFAEYMIHKYTMHTKEKLLPVWIFQNHAIEHHMKGRNDINIDLPVRFHLIVGSPMIILAFLISIKCFIALLLVFAFHSYMWTKLHRAIHGLEKNWLLNTSYFRRAKEHHELHHDRPGKNFGVVFLFTDRLFGTKVMNSNRG